MKKILIAEDELISLNILEEEFTTAGYYVVPVSDGDAASEQIKQNWFDLALLDIQLPHKTGLQLLREIRSQYRDTIVIIITAYASVQSAVEAMKNGATDYITKPYSTDELLAKTAQLLSSKKKSEKCSAVRSGSEEYYFFSGSNDQMLEEMVEKVKDIPTTVLFTGESGTGKTLLAKEIHHRGNRSSLPFIHVNCAAIPANLIESELFGHERGSFTGAVTTQKGKFEAAGQGTLFLDEVGLMPLSFQSKLLNVLQEKRFERIGGSKPLPLEARIIAATNVDLEECVENGTFRRDLYYRLNVIQIEVPPLRYRRSDILPLAKLFIRRYEGVLDKKIKQVDEDFWASLLKYNWPGNIRELENTVESAVALCEHGRLTFHLLPMRITQGKQNRAAANSVPSDFKLFLSQQESSAILAALDKFGGHREKTAQYLGISKRTLQYKLKNLNLLE